MRVCWSRSNVAAYAKSRAFRNLGLWCDLWLGSLVCSIWSFVDLTSQSWGLEKIRHSERSQKTKQSWCFKPTSGAKEFTFYKNLWPSRGILGKSSRKKCPALFRLVKYGNPDEFPFIWVVGCEIKGVSRDFLFFYDHHNFIRTFFNKNGIEQRWSENTLPTNALVSAVERIPSSPYWHQNQLRPEDLGLHVWWIRESLLRFHDTETSQKQRMQTQQQQQ